MTSDNTGQVDREAARENLERANTERLARDPFSTVPDTDDAAAPARQCPECHFVDGHSAFCQHHQQAPGCGAASCDVTCAVNGCNPTCECQAPAPAPAPAAVQLYAAEWPYPQLSAADFSAIYTAAAGHIKARGYYAYEVQGYADEPGLSITGALKLAALEHVTAADPAATHEQHTRDAHDMTEELETRLSAVLYVFGQAHLRTGISDLSDMHVAWSLGHFTSAASGRHTGWAVPTAAYALALLEQAARIFGVIADDAAPVTEADAPARM